MWKLVLVPQNDEWMLLHEYSISGKLKRGKLSGKNLLLWPSTRILYKKICKFEVLRVSLLDLLFLGEVIIIEGTILPREWLFTTIHLVQMIRVTLQKLSNEKLSEHFCWRHIKSTFNNKLEEIPQRKINLVI